MNNIIKIDAKDLPAKLKKIRKPPKRLYALGNIDLLYKDSFGIIGSRRITEYGIKNCEFFTQELALRDIPIVSGLAKGTDTVTHRTSIKCNGFTIAVLGCGLNKIFPKENEKLFKEIVEKGGLVITEYEEDVEADKNNFPERNRIIAGISEGILVIEASSRSGTSITARNATEQGKKVFALPGRLDSIQGIGVNNLIKKGAILTTCVEDILKYYPQFIKETRINVSQKTIPLKLSRDYKIIYLILEKGECFFEEILEKSNLEIRYLLKLLTKMEMEKFICQDFYGRYKLTERS